jgi:hypothetical protein
LFRSIAEWPSIPTGHPWHGRRPAAHCRAESGDPAIEFIIDLLKLMDPLDLINGHTKSAQHTNEKEPKPQLQPPANGFGEHGEEIKPRCNSPVRAA